MGKTIKVSDLILILKKSELDQTIKDILIRDIQAQGVSQFYVDQVVAYCDNAIAVLKDKLAQQKLPSA